MTNADRVQLAADQALESVYRSAIAGKMPADRRKFVRYPCTAMVWVAIVTDHFPARDELQLAMCHDVSIDGIAFYFRHIADGQRVVLSLDRSTELLLEARTVSSHPVSPSKSSPDYPCVIHCEFVGKLLPERFA